jgi:hypothetical protein
MRIRLCELHPNLPDPVHARTQIHHFAGRLFSRSDVPQAQLLSFLYELLQLQQRSMRIHDQRPGVFHEWCSVRPFARNPQRDRQQNSLAAPLIGSLCGPNVWCAHGLASPLLWLSACMLGTIRKFGEKRLGISLYLPIVRGIRRGSGGGLHASNARYFIEMRRVNTMGYLGSFFARKALRLFESFRPSRKQLDELVARTSCSRALQTVPVWNLRSGKRLLHTSRFPNTTKQTCP